VGAQIKLADLKYPPYWEYSMRLGAKDYNTTRDYKPGQLISRPDGLYKNIAEITIPEAYNVTKWQKVADLGISSFFDSDSDTGINAEENTDEDMLRFNTAGVERMRITNTGQVLFGNNTLANTSLLGSEATVGRLRITAGNDETFNDSLGASVDLHTNTSPNSGRLDLVAGSAAAGASAAITFWTNPTGGVQQQSITLAGNGNLGIGTATPTDKLEINSGTANDSGLTFNQLNSSSILSANNNTSLTVNASGKVILVSEFPHSGVKTITTNYTLLDADHATIIYADSATDIDITVPATLPTGFSVSVIQANIGLVTFIGTISNAFAQDTTAGQWATVNVQTPVIGTNVLSGETN